MKATLWLCSLIVMLCTATRSSFASPLIRYQYSQSPKLYQDNMLATPKRTKPSLSIVNPLEVLRQRLLLEIARRQMRINTNQVAKNREILNTVGKRSESIARDVADYVDPESREGPHAAYHQLPQDDNHQRTMSPGHGNYIQHLLDHVKMMELERPAQRPPSVDRLRSILQGRLTLMLPNPEADGNTEADAEDEANNDDSDLHQYQRLSPMDNDDNMLLENAEMGNDIDNSQLFGSEHRHRLRQQDQNV